MAEALARVPRVILRAEEPEERSHVERRLEVDRAPAYVVLGPGGVVRRVSSVAATTPEDLLRLLQQCGVPGTPGSSVR